jgi:hypothetical protein
MSTHDLQKAQQIREDLSNLADVIENIVYKTTPLKVEIPDRTLSGNAIRGGEITSFSSTGIKDDSSRLVVLVNDDGILTDFIDVETLVGNVKIEKDLHVGGQITADKLHVKEITSDVRHERSSPLEFASEDSPSAYGKGLHWKGSEPTKQFILRNTPDRLYSTETLDLAKEKEYMIDKVPVLGRHELGRTVTKSNLRSVGTLDDLKVSGDLNVDEFLFYNSISQRLSLGLEEPNGMFSLASLNGEFIIEPQGPSTKIGNYTNSDLTLVTDDTNRLTITRNGHIHLGPKGAKDAQVSVNGKLGIGVNNVSTDVDLEVSGPIRIENKKFEVASNKPTSGLYNIGDIVWNDQPKPTGYVGWICTKTGTPGLWKSFGQIGN